MKIKKPKFWDLKRLTFISIILYPLSLIVLFRSLFNFRSKLIFPNIKTICVGNIYVGGTGKTPLVIKINEFLVLNGQIISHNIQIDFLNIIGANIIFLYIISDMFPN